jgi:CheY-like chemotaxis protein
MAAVLIVEDEPDLLHALEAVLALEGHTVRMATNGTEALNAVWLQAPDIIVTDVMMPNMDGIALLGTLKAQPLLAHIPVILVSAINVPQGLPAQGFLQKPFSAAALVDLIDRLAP